MIQKASDIKLKVLPALFTCEHRYYYEGPCRFGHGEAIQPGYDRFANAQKTEVFLDAVRGCLSEGIELMEPVTISRTDDWENSEINWENAAPSAHEADFVIAMSGIACDDLVVEFAQRFKKPIAVTPPNSFSASLQVAALRAKAVNDYEVYGIFKWEDLAYRMKILRARKIIQNTRILCVNRFGSNTSYSSIDSFNMHDQITEKLGVKFRYISFFEFADCMDPASPEGNHTTPGRITPNLTDEDLEKAYALVDELIDGADECLMSRDDMLPSAIAFITTRKLMDLKDCNGFTMPCPDVCSTRILNQKKFTMCSTHSLNMEDCIPSACEYDSDAVLSQQALIAVSGKSPYMGNTCPIPFENGHFTSRFGGTPEQMAALEADPANIDHLYMMQHSVAHRNHHNDGKKSPYAIRSFAVDQNFGTTLRYNFSADKGQKITLCRFSPDASKMFIGSGEIVMGGGYEGFNCSQLVYFRVKDLYDTWDKQCFAGNHVSLVYGDYVKELKDLAISLGVEPLVAD